MMLQSNLYLNHHWNRQQPTPRQLTRANGEPRQTTPTPSSGRSTSKSSLGGVITCATAHA